MPIHKNENLQRVPKGFMTRLVFPGVRKVSRSLCIHHFFMIQYSKVPTTGLLVPNPAPQIHGRENTWLQCEPLIFGS